MRFREFVAEYREPKSKRARRDGVDLEAWKDGLEFQITATAHDRDLGRVVFDVQYQGDQPVLVAKDLMILPKYRGQGIAAIMYDYAKELGYRVERSSEQTDAGRHFWDKNRGEQGQVWESEDTAKIGKLAKSGKIVRIYRREPDREFDGVQDWLLVDMDPAKGVRGQGLKWIPGNTRFEWVRDYLEKVDEEKTLDPDLYGEMLPTATVRRIVTGVMKQVDPTARVTVKQSPEGYYICRSEGLRLDFGITADGGDINANIVNAYSSYKGAGVVTQIFAECFRAAEQLWGTPQKFVMSAHEDRGHGVWQHIAQKLGAEWEGSITEQKESTPAQAFIQNIYSQYPEWPYGQADRVMVWGEGEEQQFAAFKLKPGSTPDTVEIDWIMAGPEQRKGVGSRAIKELQQQAQQDGIRLTLYPWAKGQISQASLTKLYRRHGFKPQAKGAAPMAWEPVNEIARIPQGDFGTAGTIDARIPDVEFKELPGGSGMTYGINRENDLIEIMIVDDGKLAGELDIVYTRGPAKTWAVDSVAVDPQHRGRGIAKALYGIALSILKLPLEAGQMQTRHGQHMWLMLNSIPGVEVVGYNHEPTPQYQARSGDEIIHQDKNRTHYIFPVTAGKKSMRSRRPGTGMYTSPSTTMIARWTGS